MPGAATALLDAVLEAGMTDRGLWLILTGTGRCGTGYMAQVLTSIGVNCTHEGVFNPVNPQNSDRLPDEMELRRRMKLNQDEVAWGWQAESSWLAAPYLTVPEMETCTIIHLVRHPKSVIDSQMRIRAFGSENKHPRFYNFQLQFLPELASMEPFHAAAYYYVRWNLMIEPYADIRHRIDRDSTLELLDWLALDWRKKDVYANKRYNSRGGWGQSDVDLDDLPDNLRLPLRAMTERYGYEWGND
jgi:hypothetical protein